MLLFNIPFESRDEFADASTSYLPGQTALDTPHTERTEELIRCGFDRTFGEQTLPY